MPTVNRSRRRTLKALGALGVVSVAGSRTALGAQLDALVADGRLSTVQAAQLFTQVEKLTATDAVRGDSFGYSVSVSGDGSTALVGAYLDDDAGPDSGAAYVFELELLEVFPEPIVLKNGKVVDPQDFDDDGLYEDGDGDVDGQDVSRSTQLENAYRKGKIQLTDAQVAALDFDGDGEFTKKDIAAYSER